MKRIITFLMILIMAIFCAGCSIGTSAASSKSNSKPVIINQQAKLDKAKQDMNTKLLGIRANYTTLRTQAEDQRLSKRNANLDIENASRTNNETALIKQYSDNIDAKYTDEMSAIDNQYTNAKSSISSSGEDSTTQQTDLSAEAASYSQAVYNEKTKSDKLKLSLNNIKRQYDTKIQQAQTTRDSNEDTFKKQCTAKYDDAFNKITSTNTGSGSDWDRLLNAEQQELIKYYEEEDKKFNDSASTAYSWLQETLSKTFK